MPEVPAGRSRAPPPRPSRDASSEKNQTPVRPCGRARRSGVRLAEPSQPRRAVRRTARPTCGTGPGPPRRRSSNVSTDRPAGSSRWTASGSNGQCRKVSRSQRWIITGRRTLSGQTPASGGHPHSMPPSTFSSWCECPQPWFSFCSPPPAEAMTMRRRPTAWCNPPSPATTGPALTHDQYQAAILRIVSGADAREASRLFTDVVANDYASAECATRVGALRDHLRAIVDEAAGLNAPADAVGSQREFVSAASESVRLVGVAAADVGSGDLKCGAPLNRTDLRLALHRAGTGSARGPGGPRLLHRR